MMQVLQHVQYELFAYKIYTWQERNYFGTTICGIKPNKLLFQESCTIICVYTNHK